MTAGDRATWTFPGDRYERAGMHWVKIDSPRRACSPDESRQAAAVVQAVRHGTISLGMGLARLRTVMAEHGLLPDETPEGDGR